MGGRLTTLLCVSLVAGACGGSAAPAEAAAPPKPPPITDVERYMPLEHDTVYAYDTVDDRGQTGMLVMEVSRPRAGRADLKVGSTVERLDIVEGGIRRLAGGWVLKSPLEVGAEWKDGMKHIRVTSVDTQVQVKAGSFVGCIETVEESGSAMAGKKVTSTYCPDVGMVVMDVVAAGEGEIQSLRAELRSFGPRVDLGAPIR